MPTVITINCPVSFVYSEHICLLKESVENQEDIVDLTAHILKKISLKFGNTRYDQTILQISFFLIAAKYLSCLRSKEFWFETNFSKLVNLASHGLQELELPLFNISQSLDYPIDLISIYEFSDIKNSCRTCVRNNCYALIIEPEADWGAICNSNHPRLQFFD